MAAFCFLIIFIENCVDMVIYLKESDYNRLIAEGKSYKKSQIRLRENVDANIASAKNVTDAITQARQNISNNSNVNTSSIEAGKMDGKQNTQSGEGMKLQVPINASGSELSSLQNIVKNPNNDDMQIQFTKPMNQGTTTTESIDYIKKSAIPFTKKELSSFLQTI